MMNQELVLIFTIKNSLVINCLVYFRTRKLSLKSSICKIFLQEFYFLLNLNDAVMPPGWEIRAASRSSSELGFPKSQSNVCLYFGCIYNKYTQNHILCIWWIERPGFIGLLLHWIAMLISWTGAQLRDPACQRNFSWVCMWRLPSRATLWKKAFPAFPPPCHSSSGTFPPGWRRVTGIWGMYNQQLIPHLWNNFVKLKKPTKQPSHTTPPTPGPNKLMTFYFCLKFKEK